MADDRLDQLSNIDDAEATLRDDMQQDEGTVELSASDIVALAADEPDAVTTQVIERSKLDQKIAADSTSEDLRTTMQSEVSEMMTAEHQVPEELLDKMLPTNERAQRFQRGPSGEIVERGPSTDRFPAIGTRPMPRVEAAERTAELDMSSGELAELDEEGFYTFIVRTDEQGRVKLPKALLDGQDPADGVMVFVKAKSLK